MFKPTEGEEFARDFFVFVLMFFILVGNALIIAAFIKNRLLRTGSNVFIVGLAASDWLVGAIAIPLYVANLKKELPGTLLERSYITLDIFSGTASVFHLVSVTVERYIAITRPFLHRTLLLDSYYKALAFVWALSLILSCLDVILTPKISSKYPFYILVTLFFLALVTIVPLDILIFKISRSLIRNTVEPAVHSTRSNETLRRKLRRERRTAATITITCGAFFVTWLPHLVAAFVFTFCFPCNLSPVDIGRVGAFVKCMQYANSALNPFVFAFRDAQIRTTIKRMINPCLNIVQSAASSSQESS